nr:zinc finger, BED-type [Tanacetum cinerariifolium]
MVEEYIPVKVRTSKQMQEDILGEQAVKRLHNEEQAQLDRQRAKMQRRRQEEVLDSAMYYTEADWLNIMAQVEANASLSKTLLGDDVSEDNFPAIMAALIKRKKQALAEKLAKKRQNSMAYVKSFTDDQLKEEFEKIRKVQSNSQIQTFSGTLKRPGPVLDEPSSKRQKSTKAPIPYVPEVPHSPAVSSPPSFGTRRKSLGRKHLTKPKSTLQELDLYADAKIFIKVVSTKDSGDEAPPVWSALVGWEVISTPLGDVNALYRIDQSTKHFTTLRQILHMGDLQVLFDSHTGGKGSCVWKHQHLWEIRSWRLYTLSNVHVLETVSGEVLYMFADVSYPLSVKLMERMLTHKLEIDMNVVGNDMTTAEQLIQFIKNQLAASQPKGTVKAIRSQILVTTINFNPPSQILDAQAEAIKEENVENKNLHSINNELKLVPMKHSVLRKQNWLPCFRRINISILKQASTPFHHVRIKSLHEVTAVKVRVNVVKLNLVLLSDIRACREALNKKKQLLYTRSYKEIDQDSVHMVAASKVPMLKPGKYELWRIRMEQYIQMVDYSLWEVIEMVDYSLWEVIENVAELPKEEHEGHHVEQPLAFCDPRLVLRNGLPTRQDMVIVEEEGNVTPIVIEEEGVIASTVEEEGRPERVVSIPLWHKDYAPCLDVDTRWNSTFLMLETVVKFKKVIDRLELTDRDYASYFNNDTKDGEEGSEASEARNKDKGKAAVIDVDSENVNQHVDEHVNEHVGDHVDEKKSRLKSFVWDYFPYDEGATETKCPYCSTVLTANSKQNGTSTLVVRDGLEEQNASICKIRNVVKYLRSSSGRQESFKKGVEFEKAFCKRKTCRDVDTRWNSTFLMLETTLKFEKVIDR